MSRHALGAIVAVLGLVSLARAEGPPPPPGWGKPAPLPPANGTGKVTFKHGGTPMALPLNEITIDSGQPDMLIVSLAYVDASQENKLDLTFASMPKLGKNDPHPITGFVVRTKAHGLSKDSANRTKCDLVIVTLTKAEVSGTLSCKGMTDMSAQEAAPDVTDVKFEGKVNAK